MHSSVRAGGPVRPVRGGATRHTLLVGAYTPGQGAGLYRFMFDSTHGTLGPRPLQRVACDNASWLVLSADRQRLYAVNENGAESRNPQGAVSAFALATRRQHLRALGRVASQGFEPTHASLSPDGAFLLVANYGAEPPGGSLVAVPLARNRRLDAVVQQLRHPVQPADPPRDPERQACSHVHAAVFAPDGLLFACDLGADKVFTYRWQPTEQPPLSPAEPAFTALPAGSGPRHLLFDASGRHAYLTLELSAQVAVFDYADGRLERRQLLDLQDGRDTLAHAPSGLQLSADGRFLYVADRGDACQIVVFAVDPRSGELRELQRRASEGREPREFVIDPSGRFLLIANQHSARIVIIRRDPLTGLLHDTVQTLALEQPACLLFVR